MFCDFAKVCIQAYRNFFQTNLFRGSMKIAIPILLFLNHFPVLKGHNPITVK